MVKFEFCSLHYLNMWLSQDMLFIEKLGSNNKENQLTALKKIAASYRIARNLPLASDKNKDKQRYEPVLSIINNIGGPIEEQKIVDLVNKTNKAICDNHK